MLGVRVTLKRSFQYLIGAMWFPLAALANTGLVPTPPAINADSYLLIDFDTGRIVTTLAVHRNFNWMKIAHSVIKKGK